MEVRLWKPGRVNMDLLIQKLKNILQFSLWDLITEYSILTTPIREKIYGNYAFNEGTLIFGVMDSSLHHIFVLISSDGTQEVIRMNNKFYESIPTWLQSGCVLNVPAVKLHTIELTTRFVKLVSEEVELVTNFLFPNLEDRGPYSKVLYWPHCNVTV